MADIPETSSPGEDPWLTVQQVSQELKIHPATVRVWIKQGRLQAVRAGKGFRVRRSEVERALGAEPAPAPSREQASLTGEAEAAASPPPAPRQIADQIITVAAAAGREP